MHLSSLNTRPEDNDAGPDCGGESWLEPERQFTCSGESSPVVGGWLVGDFPPRHKDDSVVVLLRDFLRLSDSVDCIEEQAACILY